MVIRLRNGRTIRSPPGIKKSCLSSPCDNERDSPVPSLRASSSISSFDELDVELSETGGGTALRGFKWMIGVVLGAIAIAGFRLQLSPRYTNTHDHDTTKLQALYQMPLPKNKRELVKLNDELAGLDPSFILQWAHHHLHDAEDAEERNSHPLVQATSFGPTGLVILDHLAKDNLLETIPVITMDTLHLFRESYVFYETVQSHYKSALHLTVTKPKHNIHGSISTRQHFQDVYGSELWKTDPKTYTKLTKSDPMQQKLEEWQAVMWITGRRRSQGGERAGLDILEFEPYTTGNATDMDAAASPFDPSRGRWKLNPLAYWSYDKVWSYIRNNSVPYNTLYDQGYTSIGDEMTTSLPKEKSDTDEHGERSGRFNGFMGSNRECGLHVDLDMDLVGMELDDDNNVA
jgi:phosphoadenosine phosphosulfate reductase